MNYENAVRRRVFNEKCSLVMLFFLRMFPLCKIDGGHIISEYDLYNRKTN